MTDHDSPQSFEARLTDAFARYVELAPTTVNASAVTASIVVVRHRAAARWTAGRLAVMGSLLLVGLLAAAILATGGHLLDRRADNGPTLTGPSPTVRATDVPADLAGGGTVVVVLGCLNTITLPAGTLDQDCEKNTYSTLDGGTVFDSWIWSPTGQQAVGYGSGGLYRFDRATKTRTLIPGTETSNPPALDDQTAILGWSPRGTYILRVGASTTPGPWGVFVGRPDGKEWHEIPSAHDGSSWSPMWSQDETRLVTPINESTASLSMGDGLGIERVMTFARSDLLAMGPGIALRSVRGPTTAPLAADVATTDGLYQAPRTITSFPDGTFALTAGWSDDGVTLAVVTSRQVGAADADYQLWLVGPGEPRHFALSIPVGARPTSVTWAASDGHLIVASQEPDPSYRKHVTIVSVRSGAVVAQAYGAIFSPDGQWAMYDAPRSDGNFDAVLLSLATGRTRTLTTLSRGFGPALSLMWLP